MTYGRCRNCVERRITIVLTYRDEIEKAIYCNIDAMRELPAYAENEEWCPFYEEEDDPYSEFGDDL